MTHNTIFPAGRARSRSPRRAMTAERIPAARGTNPGGTAARGVLRPAARLLGALLTLALLPLLAGCLYPDEMRKENRINPKESILLVQNAVDEYKRRTGVLPIKTVESDTPVYEKYVIDMKKLTEGYLSQVPGLAFENGGSFLFVLVNPEAKPEVKLLDVAAYQKTGDIQKLVDDYKAAHGGQLPKGEPLAAQFYRLDFAKMGKKPEQVASVYSPQYLGFILHESGTVAIDYAPEIRKAMERRGMASADPGIDLRTLLVSDAPFVPVKSYPYYWKNNEPQVAAE